MLLSLGGVVVVEVGVVDLASGTLCLGPLFLLQSRQVGRLALVIVRLASVDGSELIVALRDFGVSQRELKVELFGLGLKTERSHDLLLLKDVAGMSDIELRVGEPTLADMTLDLGVEREYDIGWRDSLNSRRDDETRREGRARLSGQHGQNLPSIRDFKVASSILCGLDDFVLHGLQSEPLLDASEHPQIARKVKEAELLELVLGVILSH